MNRFFRALTAAALTIALLSAPACAGYYPDKTHTPADHAHMSFEEFDEAPLTQALDELEDLIRGGSIRSRDPKKGLKALRLYHRILDGYDLLYTQYALAMIHYDGNYTDPDAANRYYEYEERLTILQDRCLTVLQLLAKSPYSNILDGTGLVESLRNYAPLTDEELELYRQESALVSEYEQLLNTDYDLQTMGELYLELVRVRNQIALLYGYDNYADYAYQEVYFRDYTLQEIEAVQEEVRGPFSTLFTSVQSAMDSQFQLLRDLEGADAETRLDAIEPCIARIHPELVEAFTFLRENHLYDLDEREVKLPVGYTVDLPHYGAAFIFDAPYGNVMDYATIVHEFGHFNNAFHSTEPILWSDNNMDVSEIQSQALELLFTEYADEIFGDLGPAFRWYEVSYLLSGVLDGFMYNEFEAAVARDPDMPAEEVNKLFLTIADSYGGGYEAADWMETTHLFQSPFYYISYGTSALSALDIWLTSLTDREAGIDAYMTVSALPASVPYRQALERAGVRDIFAGDNLARLIREIDLVVADELGLPLPDTDRTELKESLFANRLFPFPLVACFLPALVVAAAVLILVLRRRKRRLEEPDDFSRRGPTRYREDPWD